MLNSALPRQTRPQPAPDAGGPPLPQPEVLLIEGCNFADFPRGGQLTEATQMMQAFGNRLALVGMCTDQTPIGRWVDKEFGGQTFRFLGVMRADRSRTRKPPVPARLTFYWALRRHMKAVRALGVRKIIVQSPEALLAVSRGEWEGLCYRAPGVANTLANSRYRWSRPFRGVYERAFFRALLKADVVLASADSASIEKMVSRSRGLLDRRKVVPFPTRVDTSLFYPRPQAAARRALGLAPDATILVSCGRLNWIKGWDLLLQAFALLRGRVPSATIIFVGDGEDRPAVEAEAAKLGLGASVIITGFQPRPRIAEYLAAADLFVMGSHSEGWSVAMLEALASGKRMVCTDVSGAREMIEPGRNGYIVTDRRPESLADAVERGLGLDAERAAARSVQIASRFALATLPAALADQWPALRPASPGPGPAALPQ